MTNVAEAFLVIGCFILVWRAVEAIWESAEKIKQDKAAYDSERQASSPRFQRR